MNIPPQFEYDILKFTEIGNFGEEKYDPLKKCLVVKKSTRESLEELNKKIKFAKFFSDNIKFQNYVGIIKFGDVTLEILPKFLSQKISYEPCNLSQTKENVLGNLIYMLEMSNFFGFKHVELANLNYKSGLNEIFIKIFADRLLELLKIIKNKSYTRFYENLKFLKGKVDFNRYGLNPAEYHRIPCRYYDMSLNDSINQTLKYTSSKLANLVENKETYKTLKKIMAYLEPVNFNLIDLNIIRGIHFNRLNNVYKPFIDFCEKFLRSSMFTLEPSKLDFFSILIPMEKLFEKFIGKIIKKKYEELKPSIQKRVGHLAYVNESGYFTLKPDIILKNNNDIFIIDTKYKMLNMKEKKYNVSQQDLYQMYTYCRELNAKKCLLIYPEGLNGEINAQWKLGKEKNIDLFIRTIPLTYDLKSKDGREKFYDNLSDIMQVFE